MNNSKIVYDNLEKDDNSSFLQKRGELSQIVEALNRVESSEDWQKLKRLVLDGVIVNLERQLKNQSQKDNLDLPEMYRLQGQLAWARKYADLKKLAEFFKQSILNINLKLNEKFPSDEAL